MVLRPVASPITFVDRPLQERRHRFGSDAKIHEVSGSFCHWGRREFWEAAGWHFLRAEHFTLARSFFSTPLLTADGLRPVSTC